MNTAPPNAAERRPVVGCVSFLNARPLSDGLEQCEDLRLRYDVPSALLPNLLNGTYDLALCPVIDFQTAASPLCILPVGGIGCDGPTLTVRLFSRVPLHDIREVHVDTDSHTSIALLRILLNERYGLEPLLTPWSPSTAPAPDTMLLIGDKVVTAAPDESDYQHQLDLGEAWQELTGLPFLFAVWMTRADVELGRLPEQLDARRLHNAERIEAVADRHAAPLGWPAPLARQYLGELLRYAVDHRMLQAVQLFWAKAHDLGLIPSLRPLRLYDTATAPR